VGGWLVAWTRDGSTPDAGKWERAARCALGYGGQWTEHRTRGSMVGAWRRQTGEFPQSGVLIVHENATVAWMGQCLGDGGDVSYDASSLLAEERFDDQRIANLNGPFGAVVVREKPFEVRVVTDRYRHYPVYVHRGPADVVASTDIRCIVPWLSRPTIDVDSVDMLLRCGELIDRMTMLRGVEMLPPGTVLRDSGNGPCDRRYWAMRHDGSSGALLAQSADALAERITTAVRRIERVTPRLGVTLSGGLDSRMILDLCEHPECVPSFTWGLPGCRDIRCASRFAALVKSPHTVREWEIAAFPPCWPRGVDLTAGGFGVESMYMLPFVPLLSASCDVVLNGLAGDAILGGNFLKHSWLGEPDIARLGLASWRWRVSPAEDQLVDGLTGRAPGPSGASARWTASIVARDGARPVERLNDWLYENRIFRYTNSGTMLLRSGVESHAPYWDRDFIDAVIAVRQEYKFKHRLYLEVMRRAAPRAASVAWQRTNLAPACGYYANLTSMAMQRLLIKGCAPIGCKPFKYAAVADPAGWFRTGWSQKASDIVLSERLTARGLLNPDEIRKMWHAHRAGEDHTRQLGALVAIELFARQVLDGLGVQQLSDTAGDAHA
jgi:asparagine synthase (glutamine-hydrolysing)